MRTGAVPTSGRQPSRVPQRGDGGSRTRLSRDTTASEVYPGNNPSRSGAGAVDELPRRIRSTIRATSRRRGDAAPPLLDSHLSDIQESE